MLKDLTSNRLKIVLEHISKLNVMVVGQFILDIRFEITDSPAGTDSGGPLITNPPIYNLPSSGAIVRNLIALGARQVIPVGLLGADGNGWQIRTMLNHPNCNLDQLFIAPNWATLTEIRPTNAPKNSDAETPISYQIRNQEKLHESATDKLLKCIQSNLGKVDTVIICDPLPDPEAGLFNPQFRTALAEMATSNEATSFWVHSPYFFHHYDSMTSVVSTQTLLANRTQTDTDAESITNTDTESISVPSYEEIQKEAILIRSRMKRPVFVNLQESGIMSCDRSTSLVPGIPMDQSIDLWGGEEAVIATAAAASATGATSIEAAQIAVLAAAEVHAQKGSIGIATAEGVTQRFDSIPNKS